MYPLSLSNGVVCSVCVSVAGCVCSVVSCSTARVLARVAGVVLLWLLVCALLGVCRPLGRVVWCWAGRVALGASLGRPVPGPGRPGTRGSDALSL